MRNGHLPRYHNHSRRVRPGPKARSPPPFSTASTGHRGLLKAAQSLTENNHNQIHTGARTGLVPGWGVLGASWAGGRAWHCHNLSDRRDLEHLGRRRGRRVETRRRAWARANYICTGSVVPKVSSCGGLRLIQGSEADARHPKRHLIGLAGLACARGGAWSRRPPCSVHTHLPRYLGT